MALTNITWEFFTSPSIPRNKVGVEERRPNHFYVVAQQDLTEAQIVMAIARWIISRTPNDTPDSPPDGT